MKHSLTFLPSDAIFQLSVTFSFADYIDAERELWALFPESEGRRVNFIQTGLMASLYIEVTDDGSELLDSETYVLMPHSDNTMRPIRMIAVRRLSLDEFRLCMYTALKLGSRAVEGAVREAGNYIAGEELLAEMAAQ